MSRVYGEPVDVWVRDGKPARFVWRGRLYAVLGVLEHWVVSREWWQQRGPGAGTPPGDGSRPSRPASGSRADVGSRAASGSRADVGSRADAGPGAGMPTEHEFWRVEATPGRSSAAATYELRRDAATGSWLLARVWD